MTSLVVGLALWWAAHVFKRAAPGPRAALSVRFGDASKGIFALVLVVAVVLMVIGYRSADFIAVYSPPGWTVHLNNLLMLGAVFLFGAGSSKGRARSWFRHPMLMGFAVWAGAHLLVNGDLASVLLFGALLIWALVEIALINYREPSWTRPSPGPAKGDLRLAIISVVLFGVIAAIHAWLGVWPFPG